MPRGSLAVPPQFLNQFGLRRRRWSKSERLREVKVDHLIASTFGIRGAPGRTPALSPPDLPPVGRISLPTQGTKRLVPCGAKPNQQFRLEISPEPPSVRVPDWLARLLASSFDFPFLQTSCVSHKPKPPSISAAVLMILGRPITPRFRANAAVLGRRSDLQWWRVQTSCSSISSVLHAISLPLLVCHPLPAVRPARSVDFVAPCRTHTYCSSAGPILSHGICRLQINQKSNAPDRSVFSMPASIRAMTRYMRRALYCLAGR
ncbi:hypothetical protein CALCODRAFT_202359 [Calocera cornea HHB12733]|uniref:Uncharacterized protein n=1 Tax=Calocera cornea HHB12733 TaxID=1353952 RepID=A0A165JXZ8_9BASI|nr:hypothetical protein CALCODRAFT_202359 [Calocera cornea HHB12733]